MSAVRHIVWQKRGKIFDPNGRFPFMHQYAQAPAPFPSGDRLRVFITCRPPRAVDGSMVSHITYVDVSAADPSRVLHVHDRPILPLGGLGDFDEFGIHPVGAVPMDDALYLYYQGWTRGASVPYITSLGLALSHDGGQTFTKYARGPLFSRTPDEPYLENGFFVLKEEDGLRMWYATGIEWREHEGVKEPLYRIVAARSRDGIHWERDARPLFPPAHEGEVTGRPTVLKCGGIYRMWFSKRDVTGFRSGGANAYRIGYAWSTDGDTWTRADHLAGIDVSAEGWDSEMQAYPFVVRSGRKLYLFYNGNAFGRDGFGYAEADADVHDTA